MQYYIRIRGKEFGPFGEDQLKKMRVNGKLSRTTEVSENKTEWFPAENLEFLFPTPKQASSQTKSSDTSISVSPTTSEPAEWFYCVNGTEGFGPVTQTDIVQMIQARTLRGESLVWQQGKNAEKIHTINTFAHHLPPITPVFSQNSARKTKIAATVISILLLIVIVLGTVVFYVTTENMKQEQKAAEAKATAEKTEQKDDKSNLTVVIEKMPYDNGSEFIRTYGSKYFGNLAKLTFEKYRNFSKAINTKCEKFVTQYQDNDLVQNIAGLQEICNSVMDEILDEWNSAIKYSSVKPEFSLTLSIMKNELEKNKVFINIETCMTLIRNDIKKLDKKTKENTIKLYAILSQYQTSIIDPIGSYRTYSQSHISYKDDFTKTLSLAKLE
ncbi:MAG: DUF4339 domain-containing protein, partial [Planctomycetaceae bacterium]|jgi:hypothetical protein|nr:DUF4339 domain-containing protein [Planctomycetaceae bacterium]